MLTPSSVNISWLEPYNCHHQLSLDVESFGIGDADVTIWGGLDGVVDSGLEESQGSHWGLQSPTLYHCPLIVRSLSLARQCPCGLSPFAHWGAASSLSTVPKVKVQHCPFEVSLWPCHTIFISTILSLVTGSQALSNDRNDTEEKEDVRDSKLSFIYQQNNYILMCLRLWLFPIDYPYMIENWPCH